MKNQTLFSGQNKLKGLVCCLLVLLPSMKMVVCWYYYLALKRHSNILNSQELKVRTRWTLIRVDGYAC